MRMNGKHLNVNGDRIYEEKEERKIVTQSKVILILMLKLLSIICVKDDV